MAHAHEESYRPAVTVNILPDDIFREIFAFCLSNDEPYPWHMVIWQTLVQVCQRWQQVIYGSPHYLDLHLHCSDIVPFWKNLGRWPEFPLILCYSIHPNEDEDVDDLIAALEHYTRVHHLDLFIGSWNSRVYEVLEKMQVPFPMLTYLELTGPDADHESNVYDISDHFLGNSAPCLQHLHLDGISFQGLPKLLLSTRGLVSLQLKEIPADILGVYGYISPKAMVGGLDGLIRLRTLCIEFRLLQELSQSNERLEKGRHPDPPKRPVLPALTRFEFIGESKYLEDLVAQIDMPSIEDIKIEYFPPSFDVPQLSQFLGRIASLELAQFRRAQVTFDAWSSQIRITFDRPHGERHQVRFSLSIQIFESGKRRDSDLDVLAPRMARVLGQLPALLSNVGRLSFNSRQYWFQKMNDSNLLPLLHTFPTVEELHVSGPLARRIATALENIAEERVTELMPALHSLWLVFNGINLKHVGCRLERFLSLRQLSGHPVTVRDTEDQAEVEFDG